MTQVQTLLAVGDMILGGPDPDSNFALAGPILRKADVLVGQGEAPFTSRGIEKYYVEVPTEIFATPSCDPANIRAFANAGFHVITLAGNHIWDSGVPGIEDTISGLKKHGIAIAGAGMNIDEARRPAILERNGTRFGFLNYNCTGPKLTWATPDKPGCAYVQVVTAYELEHPTPGAPPTAYALVLPPSLEEMKRDIRRLRPQCDLLVVCLHKGLGFVPAKLAMYEQQVSHAAIDAGADFIIGHHAHMLRGVEFYNAKAIFHGLGHFVISKRPRDPKANPPWAVKQFVEKHKDLLGPYVEPDPEYPKHPYHPETLQTIIAKCEIENGSISKVGYLPCLINKQGQPEILKHDEKGQQIFDYMDRITRAANLNAQYEWDGDEVVIRPDASLKTD
ncbi:MAG: CapA family protein [Deltaproteobacteria bacterium]|nr:CapA family protein [Deltaproteobacteria bacterium]